MRTIPVDTARMRLVYIDATPAVAYNAEGEVTDDQRTDGDGRALWNVGVLVLVDGTPGGETERVRVPAEAAPKIEALSPIEFDGLVARPWQNEGRSGVSLLADGIRNGNGRKAVSTPAEG